MRCAPACDLECEAPRRLHFRGQVLLHPPSVETHTVCRRSRAARTRHLKSPPASARLTRDRRANEYRRRTGSSNCFHRLHGCRVRDHQWGRTRRPEPDRLSRKRKKQPPAADEATDVESFGTSILQNERWIGCHRKPAKFPLGKSAFQRDSLVAAGAETHH